MEPSPSFLNRLRGLPIPGLLLVIATAIVSGISTFVNLYAVHGTNSDAFVTGRNAAVALVLVPFALASSRASPGSIRPIDWARLVAIGVVGGGIPFLLFFHGLQLASAAGGGVTASFVYRTLFLMAAVFGVVFLRERVPVRIVLAAALLLAGNFLLLAFTTPIWTDGTGYVLAATVLWAAEYAISKRTLRDLPSGTVALGRMGFGALFLVLYLAATAQVGSLASFSIGQWAWMAVSAALLTGFVVTWYPGLKHVGLGTATAVLVLGFPITWALTVLVGDAPVTMLAAAGAAAIVLGVAISVDPSAFRSAGRFLRPARDRRFAA